MRRRLAGFSLIEVLVALVLLSAVLVVILPQLTDPANRISLRTDAALAEDYATSRLERLRLAQDLTSRDARGDAFGWRWHDRVTSVRIDGADEEIFLLQVTIWDGSGRAELAAVEGYR